MKWSFIVLTFSSARKWSIIFPGKCRKATHCIHADKAARVESESAFMRNRNLKLTRKLGVTLKLWVYPETWSLRGNLEFTQELWIYPETWSLLRNWNLLENLEFTRKLGAYSETLSFLVLSKNGIFKQCLWLCHKRIYHRKRERKNEADKHKLSPYSVIVKFQLTTARSIESRGNPLRVSFLMQNRDQFLRETIYLAEIWSLDFFV